MSTQETNGRPAPKSEEGFATIYADESGNKFDDDMFQQSPFFIYAWLLITEDQEIRAKSSILDLYRSEGLQLGSELRSKYMWKSPRWQKIFDKVMGIIQESEAIAYITFTEKRFEVCVLICETYLDDLEELDFNQFLKRIEFKKRLIQSIYDSVSDDLLNEFRNACIKDDVDSIRHIGNTVANILALHPSAEVSESAHYFIEGAEHPYRFGKVLSEGPKNLNLVTSHATLFSASLSMLESELESRHLKAKIVRDQDSVHGKVLDYFYEFLVKDIHLKHFLGCEEKSSRSTIGIQLADLIAGATERVLRAKIHNVTLVQTNRTIWSSLRLNLPLGKWSYQLTSDQFEKALETLWDQNSLPSTKTKKEVDPNNPLRCSCGHLIRNGNIRDYYIHLIEAHPNSAIQGLRCHICGELIPLWLGACHEIVEHNLQPPFRGDFYSEMQQDFEVLQELRAKGVRIIDVTNA